MDLSRLDEQVEMLQTVGFTLNIDEKYINFYLGWDLKQQLHNLWTNKVILMKLSFGEESKD